MCLRSSLPWCVARGCVSLHCSPCAAGALCGKDVRRDLPRVAGPRGHGARDRDAQRRVIRTAGELSLGHGLRRCELTRSTELLGTDTCERGGVQRN